MGKFFKPLSVLAGLGLLTAWSVNANAMTCGIFTLDVAIACEDGNDNNDPYPGDLNAFGVTFGSVDKDSSANETSGNDVDTGTPEQTFFWTADTGQDPGDVRAGEWFLDSNIWDLYDRLVIVIKASNEFSIFELAQGDLSGTWASPEHGLSHLSLYGIEDGTVSEPGTLALLGLGLLGIGLLRRTRPG